MLTSMIVSHWSSVSSSVSPAPDDAGVVEHQVQPASARHDVVDGGLYRGGVGDVEATRGCGARSG
jgi:hypothetical protein